MVALISLQAALQAIPDSQHRDISSPYRRKGVVTPNIVETRQDTDLNQLQACGSAIVVMAR